MNILVQVNFDSCWVTHTVAKLFLMTIAFSRQLFFAHLTHGGA